MLRRLPLKLTTIAVTESPTFMIDFALRGVGSAIIRSGMYPRASSPITMYAPCDE